MTSLRRIEANRKNAEKSTGPVTPEGKDRSRRNALTHGLAGAGAVLLDPDAALVAERLDTWRAGYVVETDDQEWDFRELVVNAVRVDACRDRESALVGYEAARAGVLWDEDRRAETEEVAARLARDPSRTVARLERTAAGCRWLRARWGDLLGLGRADWTEARVSLAFDLMGIPVDAREGDPWHGHPSPDALVASYRDALDARLRDGLDDLDAIERAMAESGRPARVSPEMARLRRYEAACLRRYEAARARLTRREVAPAPAAPAPGMPAVPPPPPVSPPEPDEDDGLDEDEDDDLVVTAVGASAGASPARRLNRRARRVEARRARQSGGGRR